MGRKALDLRLVSIFKEAARYGSFTEAGEHLGRSTAAVSRSVGRLEAELGVLLFNRTTRHLQLTQEGKRYLSEIDAGLERIIMAGEMLRESKSEAIGKVRILLPDTFCKNFVLPLLADFLLTHPGMSLEIHVQEFGSDPIEGGYDIALQFQQPKDNRYISRCLGRIMLILAASPRYLARHGVPRSIAELEKHDCINLGLSSASALDWLFDAAGTDPPVRFKPRGRCFFSGQFDAGVLGAVHGLGILQMDVAAALPHLERGTLKVVLPQHKMAGADLHLLYPHRDHLPMKTRIVIDFLANVAKTRLRPAWFDPNAFAAEVKAL